LLDLDPQGHATLGVNQKPDESASSMYDVLCGSAQINEILLHDVQPYLSIAPSNLLLSAAEQLLAGTEAREKQLLKQLADLDRSYDYILIDCPPSLGLLTINALRASDEAIVPVETSFFSLHGLGKLTETIDMVQSTCSHFLDIKILLTMNDHRTRFSREIQREIEKFFPKRIFSTVIRNNIRLREAASFGQPIAQYDPKSIGHEDYSALAKEVLEVEEQHYEMRDSAEEVASLSSPMRREGDVLIAIKEPEAKDVRIAGDFNEWIPDRKVFSIKEEEGIWRKILHLSPGRYQYRLVVDGQWREDPTNPEIVENYQGGYNSLLTVE
jgi:chromosome partitioning protein